MDEDNEQVRWQATAASVMGTSHEKTGQPCQDAYRWEILPGALLVAAVADGAGSASLGDMGAEVAARTAVDSILRREPILPENDDEWRSLLAEALKAAQEAVYEEAIAHEVTERDLATTLILIVAAPELIAAAQVGDGAVVAADVDGNISGITAPQTGEYINQTTFLVSPGALDMAQVTIRHLPVARVAVLSDGLQMLALKMPQGVPHAPFFSPLFRFAAEVDNEAVAAEQLEMFLRSQRVRERTDDDLTLLLAALVR
jgi:serine/threonine protein phosphatase PrpC